MEAMPGILQLHIAIRPPHRYLHIPIRLPLEQLSTSLQEALTLQHTKANADCTQ